MRDQAIPKIQMTALDSATDLMNQMRIDFSQRLTDLRNNMERPSSRQTQNMSTMDTKSLEMSLRAQLSDMIYEKDSASKSTMQEMQVDL